MRRKVESTVAFNARMIMVTLSAALLGGLSPNVLLAGTGEKQEASATEAKLRGRDFVKLGELKTVEGTLKHERGEWFLVVDGITHEIHMGDHDHRASTGIKLENGIRATVKGFAYTQQDSKNVDVAVCAIIIDKKEYKFRTDEGVPLWRGTKGGRGSGADGGGGRGEGSGKGHK